LPDLVPAEWSAGTRPRLRAAAAALLLAAGCTARDHAASLAWGAALVVTGSIAIAQQGILRRRRRAAAAAWQHVARIGELTRAGLVSELEGWVDHEVGTPLASVLDNLGAARHLLASGERERLPDVVTAVDEARSEAEHAALALRRMGQLLGADAGHREPVDLGAIARDAIRLLAPHAAAQGVTLAAELGEGLPPARGDGGQLLQVALGLLLQAIDNASSSERRHVVVQTALREDGIELAVADSGAALSEVARAHMLAPLAALRSGGLGIGVGIARAVVEAHGGRLAAERPPSGALLRVVLPAWTEAARPAASALRS
jgi:signal transduction histidine kinase